MNFKINSCNVCGCCAGAVVDGRSLCPDCVLTLGLSKDPYDRNGRVLDDDQHTTTTLEDKPTPKR